MAIGRATITQRARIGRLAGFSVSPAPRFSVGGIIAPMGGLVSDSYGQKEIAAYLAALGEVSGDFTGFKEFDGTITGTSVWQSDAAEAGAKWTGGSYWTTDGVGYWQGPVIDLSGAYELIVRFSQVAAFDSFHLWSGFDDPDSHWLSSKTGTGYQQGIRAVLRSGLAQQETNRNAVTGSHTVFFKVQSSRVYLSLDGDAQTYSSAQSGVDVPAARMYLGAVKIAAASILVANTGGALWDMTLVNRYLTNTERTALSGAQVNPFSVLSEADVAGCWDIANYDGSRIPDIVSGSDPSMDFIPINMTPSISTGTF